MASLAHTKDVIILIIADLALREKRIIERSLMIVRFFTVCPQNAPTCLDTADMVTYNTRNSCITRIIGSLVVQALRHACSRHCLCRKACTGLWLYPCYPAKEHYERLILSVRAAVRRTARCRCWKHTYAPDKPATSGSSYHCRHQPLHIVARRAARVPAVSRLHDHPRGTQFANI